MSPISRKKRDVASRYQSFLPKFIACCSRTLEPDTQRGEPWDMSQYSRLFGHCRIPRHKTDLIANSQAKPPFEHQHWATSFRNSGAAYVAVLHNGRYFTLPVLDADGVPLNVEFLTFMLQSIVNQSSDTADELLAPPICSNDYNTRLNPRDDVTLPPKEWRYGGALKESASCGQVLNILTAGDRDNWAEARQEIISHGEVNQQALATLENALFVLSLVPSAPTDEERSRQTMLGVGGDLFFDKHNLIVSSDGYAGRCFLTCTGLVQTLSFFVFSFEPGALCW